MVFLVSADVEGAVTAGEVEPVDGAELEEDEVDELDKVLSECNGWDTKNSRSLFEKFALTLSGGIWLAC